MANPTVPTGKNVPVHITPEMREDLAILLRNGNTTPSDVIRAAVHHMADAYRRARDYGDVPDDHDPVITGCAYAGETLPAQPAPVGGSGA